MPALPHLSFSARTHQHLLGRAAAPSLPQSNAAWLSHKPPCQSSRQNGIRPGQWTSSTRLCSSSSSSQSHAGVADETQELEQSTAVDSTVEALLTADLTAELEADGEEALAEEHAVLIAEQQGQQLESSVEENPYSPEDALR